MNRGEVYQKKNEFNYSPYSYEIEITKIIFFVNVLLSVLNAVDITVKNGRGGGVFAHKDIAINFCYWVSPTFQELMEERYNRQNLEFHVKKITDHIDEARNWLDTIDGQNPNRNRLNKGK